MQITDYEAGNEEAQKVTEEQLNNSVKRIQQEREQVRNEIKHVILRRGKVCQDMARQEREKEEIDIERHATLEGCAYMCKQLLQEIGGLDLEQQDVNKEDDIQLLFDEMEYERQM